VQGAGFSWPEVQDLLCGVSPTRSDQRRLVGVSTDTRTLKPRSLFFALEGPNFDGHEFLADAMDRGAMGAVVRNNAILPSGLEPSTLIRVEDTTAALGQLGGYSRRRWAGSLVAVTGSFGKTTTKELIGSLLGDRDAVLVAPGNENNAIGVPRLLARLRTTHQYAVVEMGTNSPGEIAYLGGIARPDVAVFTGIGEAHLEGLKDVDSVAREKGALLDALGPGGMAVLNGDDARVRALGEGARLSGPRRFVHYGLGEKNTFRATEVMSDGLGMRFKVEGKTVYLPLLGVHNVMNAMAAYTTCRELGLERADLIPKFETFQPVPGRMETFWSEESLVIDDTYNANPPAMRAALKVLTGLEVPGRRIFLAGEMKELGEGAEALHREFGKAASDSGIDVLWAIGPLAAFILDGARQQSRPGAASLEMAHFMDARGAAREIPSFLRPGDAVLVKGSRSVRLEQVSEVLRMRSRRD